MARQVKRFVRGSLALALTLCVGFGHVLRPVLAAEDVGVPYKAQIEGVADSDLRNLLKEVSALIGRQGQPPVSRTALERRAAEDEADLRMVLESEGYYDGSVRTRFDYSAAPVDAVIQIDPGPRFTIAAFDIQFSDEANAPGPEILPRRGGPQMVLGSPARAGGVLAAEARVIDRLHARGYPLAEITGRRYEVDMAKQTMAVELTVAHGGPWRFGPVRIAGATSVEPGFLARKAPWKEGAVFNESKFADYRSSLEATGLFSAVTIEADRAAATGDGALPVKVTVRERAHRTIGVGAKYSTNEGPGLQVYWQHRNLFGRAHTLDFTLTVATIQQSLEAGYRYPEFGRSDQTLFTTVALRNETNDAYNARSVIGSVGLERLLSKRLKVQAAVEPEISIIEDEQGQRTTELVSFPLIATYDTSNDALDPTKGIRAKLRVAPSVGNSEGPLSFFTVEGSAAGYQRILNKPRTILAVRGRLGLITGTNTDDIPANHRFYAGGGGSVRGYRYQGVGPLDANNDPLGGRAVSEIGAELRIRVTKSIGLVPFIEAGNVSDASFSGLDRDWRLGAGLGLRYYTPVGPLRLDVGVPLNPLRGVDDAVQIYVSIGQAF